MINLEAYFNRIGFGGSTSVTLETLTAIVAGHRLHIPFENLDVLLKRPISLELDDVQRKMVTNHRGGYCFEHGILLEAVLKEIGFSPVPHTGRVTLGRTREEAPRTHMFLVVHVKGKDYIVDVGFAALSSAVPIPFEDQIVANPKNGDRWLERDNRFWTLMIHENDETSAGWASTFDVDFPIDFVVGNHYVSTHPKSPFSQWLMLNAFTPSGRVSVMNKGVKIVSKGKEKKHEMADRKDLRALLAEHFGFDLPEVEAVRIPAIPEWD